MKAFNLQSVTVSSVLVIWHACLSAETVQPITSAGTPTLESVSAEYSKGASQPIRESEGILTLSEALALALSGNLNLAPFQWQMRADEARILQAGLRPNPEMSLQLEDAVGSGDYRGVRNSQTTLQLSQVIELGKKRAVRVEVGRQAQGVTRTEFELKRVEVLGEVTRRFIEVVAAQNALDLALTNRQIATDVLQTIQTRVKAGKGSAVEERKSQVTHARAQLMAEGARHELDAARKKLAAMWQSSRPIFQRAEANLFERKPLPQLGDLLRLVSTSPEIARWISEKNLRDAEVKLADARRKPDLTVWGGTRRLAGPDEQSFMVGFSIPLQFFDRNQGGAAQARALQGRTEAERRAAEARIGIVLLGLYEEMAHDLHILESLEKTVLPAAAEALAASNEGFAQGRFSYLEVLDSQRTIFEVKEEYIQAASEYHQLLVELEKLTGQPIEKAAEQR
jgi:cobalt-zinc-cadmium efflux system outer membrane protein